jgi:hypothetical protein
MAETDLGTAQPVITAPGVWTYNTNIASGAHQTLMFYYKDYAGNSSPVYTLVVASPDLAYTFDPQSFVGAGLASGTAPMASVDDLTVFTSGPALTICNALSPQCYQQSTGSAASLLYMGIANAQNQGP